MHEGAGREPQESLILEQAIVDRELIELVAGEPGDETRELKRDRPREENH
jgi:hypothetical protein